MSPYKIHQHFSNISEVELASFIPGFAFILFTDHEVGIEMLAGHRLEIENHSIQAKQAEYNHLPSEMYQHIRKYMAAPIVPIKIDQLLLQPQVEQSPRNILNALNDHCLCEILLRLGLLDLCRVAKTCKRLNQIAKTVFESKYKNQDISLSDLKEEGETPTHVENFLMNFGSSITSINLEIGRFDDVRHAIVGLVDQHCKNIKSFRFAGSLMADVNTDDHKEMFGRLETVIIIGGFLGVNQFLNACPQLKVVRAMMIDCLDLRRISLPRLVELDLKFFKCRGMGEFLIRHPHVELFSMTWPDPMVTDSLSNDTNQFIFDHLPNIHEMEMFELTDDKVTHLSEMKNLKSLYLDFDMKPFSRAMKQFAAKKRQSRSWNWLAESSAIMRSSISAR